MSDQPFIVFPPFNHEGIHLHTHHREIDIERSTLPSPVSTPRSRPEESIAIGWWDVGIQLLRFKFKGAVSLIRCLCTNKGLVLSNLTLAGSIVVLLLFYLSFRRRRRSRRESIVQLIRVIKEKDEKIHQLLYQVARMNELLLAAHHGVPITSKATSA